MKETEEFCHFGVKVAKSYSLSTAFFMRPTST